MSKESREKKKQRKAAAFDTDVNLYEAISKATEEINNSDVNDPDMAKKDAHLKSLVESEEKITKARKEHKRSIFFKVLCFGLSALLMVLGFIIPGAGGKLTDIGRRFMDRRDA